MQGPFIVFEGPDGSGTSTHSKLLAESLKQEGKDVFLTAEPTNGPIGLGIRELLKVGGINGTALQLLFSADRADHQDAIREALASGKIVICDRYIPSTLAYGSALGLDVAWLKELNKKFIQPVKTIVLLPPLQVCHNRLARRTRSDMLEHDTLRDQVYGAYEMLAEGDRGVTVIDTSGDRDAVGKLIRESVDL
ncbi:MAG: dTMP kinase [Patescibacteria group bacterium]